MVYKYDGDAFAEANMYSFTARDGGVQADTPFSSVSGSEYMVVGYTDEARSPHRQWSQNGSTGTT